jgi:hypothetical protein
MALVLTNPAARDEAPRDGPLRNSMGQIVKEGKPKGGAWEDKRGGSGKKGDWVEKWSMDTHGFDTLVHPFKACLIGRPNSGKTTVMHNLFLRIQLSAKPFQTLIIIQPSTSKEHDIFDATITLFDIPEIETIVSEDNGKTLIIIDDWDRSKLDNHQKRNLGM